MSNSEGTPRYVAITMTDAFFAAVTKANTENLPISTFMRNVISKALNIPAEAAPAPRRKYATPEEAKAAQKAQAKERQQLMADLLKEYRAKQAAAAKAAKAAQS